MDKNNWVKQTFIDRLLLIAKPNPGAFAAKCGFHDQLIRKYLKGTIPGIDKTVIMAEAANVSVEWLITGKELPALLAPPQHKSYTQTPF